MAPIRHTVRLINSKGAQLAGLISLLHGGKGQHAAAHSSACCCAGCGPQHPNSDAFKSRSVITSPLSARNGQHVLDWHAGAEHHGLLLMRCVRAATGSCGGRTFRCSRSVGLRRLSGVVYKSRKSGSLLASSDSTCLRCCSDTSLFQICGTHGKLATPWSGAGREAGGQSAFDGVSMWVLHSMCML